jgi:hypothetical protein
MLLIIILYMRNLGLYIEEIEQKGQHFHLEIVYTT